MPPWPLPPATLAVLARSWFLESHVMFGLSTLLAQAETTPVKDISDSVISNFLEAEALVGAGVTVAMVMILVVAAFLPKGERKKAWGPLTFLGLYYISKLMVYVLSLSEASLKYAPPFEFMAVLMLLCSMGRSSFLIVTRSIISRRFFEPFPKILVDLSQGLIFVGCFLLALNGIGVEASSLVAGSAAVTAVLGLSMRDSLGNLFAGLAIQAEQPFEVGDWIQFDDNKSHIGEVIEINWRATKVLTLDKVEVIVPNSTLALAPITNFTKPERYSRRSLYVYTPYDFPTGKAHRIILESLRGSFGLLDFPPPSVVTNKFTERGVEHWVRIFTTEFHQRDKVDGSARDRIWYAMHREGVAIPVPQVDVDLHQVRPVSPEEMRDQLFQERRRALQVVDFLKVLPEDDLNRLAHAIERRYYSAGECIIHEGETGTEFFIIGQGEVVVTVDRNDGSVTELARLGANKFFGEISCLTGSVRSASITAAEECELYVVTKAALAPLLENSPELALLLSETLARRQHRLQKITAASSNETQPQLEDRQRDLLERIRRYFSLS